jgi:hypothetical protein
MTAAARRCAYAVGAFAGFWWAWAVTEILRRLP